MSEASVPTFSVGEAIAWSWRLTWRNFWRYLLVAVIFVLINAAVSTVTSMPSGLAQGMMDSTNGNASIAIGAGSMVLAFIGTVINFLVSAFLAFATIRIALSVTRGEDVEVKTAFVFEDFGWYLLNSVVLALIVVVGFLVPFGVLAIIGAIIGGNTLIALLVIGAFLGFVVAFVISIGFTFFGFAVIDQHLTGLHALKVSWGLVRPHFWKVLGLAVLLTLIGIGIFVVAVVAGILMIIIGLLVTLPAAGVIMFGMGSLSYAYAYRRMSGQEIAA